MKLGYVILYVTDVGAAMLFYERAFGLERRFLHESGEYGELATGETTLAFAAHALARRNAGIEIRRSARGDQPPGMEVALTSGDVEAAFAKAVKAGAQPVAEPKQKPWGQTVAYVRDPDGFLVELCTPM